MIKFSATKFILVSGSQPKSRSVRAQSGLPTWELERVLDWVCERNPGHSLAFYDVVSLFFFSFNGCVHNQPLHRVDIFVKKKIWQYLCLIVISWKYTCQRNIFSHFSLVNHTNFFVKIPLTWLCGFFQKIIIHGVNEKIYINNYVAYA